MNRRSPARRGRSAHLLAPALALAPVAWGLVLAPADIAHAQAEEHACLVEPNEQILLSAPVKGVVATVEVKRGDRVAKGQLVATLESSVEETTVALARARAEAKGELRATDARLAFERRRFEQQETLHGQGIASERERNEVQSAFLIAEADALRADENHKQAKLELERARAALERRRLRSPIDGVVLRRILAPGEYAEPPEILEIVQTDPLRVEVLGPASLFGRVAPGARGVVTFHEAVEATREAEVVAVDPIVDSASGTLGIRLELPNPDGRLPAGVKCSVSFELGSAPATHAPPGAPALGARTNP
jgi:RND family efflux transporter MFP subunit